METTNVWNIEGIMQKTMQLSPQDRTLISRDNREAFRELYGKPTLTLKGEFYHRGWILPDKTLVWTAKGKGTSIEVPEETSTEEAWKRITKVLEDVKSFDAKKQEQATETDIEL
jgi:hypothetical protein